MIDKKNHKKEQRALKKALREERRNSDQTLGQKLKFFAIKSSILLALKPITKNLKIMSLKSSATTSPKTTLAGILAFIGLLSTQVGFLFDADPLTMPDWGIVAAALASLIMGLLARDSDTSSEKAGASN